jgi:hypothetical protein
MITFQIHGNVNSKIVGDPEFISFGKCCVDVIPEFKFRKGEGDRPACTVGHITGKIESSVELVVSYYRKVVWLIIICRKFPALIQDLISKL